MKKEEIYDGISYINQYTYDAYGRELNHHYPGNLEIKNNFDNKGFLTKIEHANSGQMIWRLDETILSKTDAGLDYRYNMNAQPKKIQQHQAAISLNEQNITYTPFRTVNTIEENGIELTYTYGPAQSRYKGVWKNNGTQYRKRIYASGYEINEETVNGVTTTQNISYVSSPSGLCAMYVEENGSGEHKELKIRIKKMETK